MTPSSEPPRANAQMAKQAGHDAPVEGGGNSNSKETLKSTEHAQLN
jgi:hypothetical protein